MKKVGGSSRPARKAPDRVWNKRHTGGLPPGGTGLTVSQLVDAAMRRPSGLLVPPGILDETQPEPRPQAGIPADLPPELLPPRPDLLLPASARPTAEDMFFAAPGPEDLGLPTVALDALVEEMVRPLPFTPAMGVLAMIAAELHHHARDRDRQLALAEQLFAGKTLGLLRRFVSEDPNHLAFDPRHVAALQRLVLCCAAPDPVPMRGLTQWEVRSLLAALVSLTGTLPHGDPPDPSEDGPTDWQAWAGYTIRVGAWHHTPYVLEAISRAYGMFVSAHDAPELAGHPARANIERWMADDYGLSAGQQLAGGLACASVSGALDPDPPPEARIRHIAPGFLADSAMASLEPELVQAVSADREEFRALLRGGELDPMRLAWDHTAFEQRPFLRLADGRLQLISPQSLISWMTSGLHHRALQAAERRPHPTRPRRSGSLVYLTYVGALGEHATRELVTRSLDDGVAAGAVSVHGEHSYAIGKRRLDSPDMLLDFGLDLVVVEIYAGRIPLHARASLDAPALKKAMDKTTTDKLVELSDRIDDLLRGELTYDKLDLSRVRRIWPLLVLAGDGIAITPMLWGYLREQAPQVFDQDARVQRPLIADLDDLEPLLGLVEEGQWLPELLSRFMHSPYAEMPPRNWVIATFGGRAPRPAMISERSAAAWRMAGLSLYPNSRRLAELRPSPR